MEEIIDQIKQAGYSGNATREDWLQLMKNHGDKTNFSDEKEQNRIADLYAGDIELFCKWYQTYNL